MISPDSKIKAQSVGRFLSNMVMPNIAAFIAWGLISALFIPTGWMPNAQLAQIVEPMINYLLPLLIGYTGGRMLHGERGAVVSSIMTMGLIVGADIPMLMGAMVVGPLGGLCMREFDKLTNNRIKNGFEMLVNNFSAGIIGMIGAIVAFYFIGPAVTVVSAMLTAGVEVMVDTGTLVIVAVLIEPAKVLFLNNAINHGVLSPIGVQQVQEFGHSIFFLIESNPGPGLGILLAYMMTTQGQVKQTAAGATIIHFFGGIQEVYFPYVMMKPRLLIALILGSMTGIAILSVFNSGLISAASPGSIVSILLMTPKSSLLGVSLSVLVSTAVSFLTALTLIKWEKRREQSETRQYEQDFVIEEPEHFEHTVGKQTLSVSEQNIFLGLKAESKEEAIKFAGEQLVKLGNVQQEYVDGMLKREALLSTYLGEGIALPHGMIGEKQYVNQTGVVFCQFNEGVLWGVDESDTAQIVVAIAAKGDQHIQVISSISNALDDNEALQTLKQTTNVEDVIRILNKQ
ncbi:mannitol-specific PTS transporter subunit IIC [Vibrio maerlii]|uniref:mannitol-specific PTS transporter subunit IIC n=1 Tax=Vibrio maerlii TaxID=2231648 RepID=UPI000E3BF6F7|nr:mannitol-specific PTS transporter subunit IIC [Vibrio maerlii]